MCTFLYAEDEGVTPTPVPCAEGEQDVTLLRGDNDHEQYCSSTATMDSITPVVTSDMTPVVGSL